MVPTRRLFQLRPSSRDDLAHDVQRVDIAGFAIVNELVGVEAPLTGLYSVNEVSRSP